MVLISSCTHLFNCAKMYKKTMLRFMINICYENKFFFINLKIDAPDSDACYLYTQVIFLRSKNKERCNAHSLRHFLKDSSLEISVWSHSQLRPYLPGLHSQTPHSKVPLPLLHFGLLGSCKINSSKYADRLHHKHLNSGRYLKQRNINIAVWYMIKVMLKTF